MRSYISESKRVDPQDSFIFEPEKGIDRVFKRLYLGFSDLVREFEVGCRCVLGLDGAFLKIQLGGCLLAAVGRDANNQMYLIAWVVVDTENNSNWDWFLSQLRSDLVIKDGYGWAIINDQQKVILIYLHVLYIKLHI